MGWSFARLTEWIRGAIDVEAPPESATPSASQGSAAPRAPLAEAPPRPPLSALAPAAIAAVYGPSARGWPRPEAEPELASVEHVDLRVVEAEAAHFVYTTRGLYRWRHPYELVLRVASAAPDPAAAPAWPVELLIAVGEVVRRRDRTMALGERLRDLDLADGAPYRHVIVAPDPALEWIEGDLDEGLAFLQIVPLTDARLAELDTVPAGQRNPALAAWAARDRLLLVGDGPG